MDNKMVLIFFALIALASSYSCPREICVCNLDDRGRIQTICSRGFMDSIPVADFDGHMEVLIIRGPNNDLTIGPIFRRFTQLEVLRITDSNLPAIGAYAFLGVPSLRTLDLKRNNITLLARDNFIGQELLNELDLSHNKIDILTSGLFEYLKGLQRLNLSNNKIQKLVVRLFSGLRRLKHLDLSGNPVNELKPEIFEDITGLLELRCRNCLLTELDSNLFNVIQPLIELDFGENYIKEIREHDFKHLSRLRRLSLDRNYLHSIKNNLFTVLNKLEHLDLSHNRLRNIGSDAFFYQHNLTTLDVSYNKLSNLLPVTVSSLTKLQTLNISGNILIDLYDMRHTFENLRRLSALSIADMGPIPTDLLQSFDQLKMLNVSGNSLVNTSLHILDYVSNIELLDLSRNQLDGFDEFQVEILRQIKDVKLEENPLICDRCHMGQLIDIARTLTWNVYPTCYLPESLHGKPISALNASNLDTCIAASRFNFAGISEHILFIQQNMNLFAIVCSALFICILIIALIIVLSMKYQSAKYYTHEDKLDGLYEKNLDSLSINGNELSYKHNIDDIIYTIDEMALPHSMDAPHSPKSTPSTFITRNG